MSSSAVFAPRAREDLRRILHDFDDSASAQRLRDLLMAAAERIGERPMIGRLEPRLARPRFRFWSLPAYSLLVVYNATTDPVRIVRIVHTARDLPRVLKDLRS